MLLFGLGTEQVQSQRLGFRQFNVEQGLTHSQVRSIFQDRSGYLWIGTLGGLSKFDGREFTNYGPSRGLGLDQIEDIYQLSDGRIAVGSTGEFAILTESKARTFSLGEFNRGSAIQQIIQSTDSTIWLATQAGIFRCQPGQNPEPWKEEWFGNSDIKKILFTEKGILVLSSKSLLELVGEQVDTLFSSSDSELNDLCLDPVGNTWIASNGTGLIRIGQENRQWTTDQGLISNRILKLTSDPSGNIWCGSRLGFSKIDSFDELTSYSAKNGLPYVEIRAMMIDHDDNLWLGTDGGGLIRFLGEIFAQFTTEEGLPSNLVMTITKDQSQNLWVGTYDNGVVKLTETPQYYTWENGLINNKVWTSVCDVRGRLWFGTSGGISILNDGRWSSISTELGLPGNKVTSLFEDSRDRIWAGTNAGACVFDSQSDEPKIVSAIPQVKIRGMAEAVDGSMWFASSAGVLHLSENEMKQYSTNSGLSDESCSSICFDDQDRLWVGTKNGLHLFNSEVFNLISLGEDYSSNFINFLLPLEEGMLTGTNNGLFLVTKTDSDPEIFSYSLEDGLGSLETNINAVFRDEVGIVWFGTTAGLLQHEGRFGDRWKEVPPPKINLTELRLNLSPTAWNSKGFETDSLTGMPLNLELPYLENNLTFYFTGISTNYPDDVRYHYILENFDDNWQPLSDIDFATYTNIPSGNFIFRVQAFSKENKWSEVLEFPFGIHPPFWATWWFISISTLLFMGLVFTFIQRRKRRLIEQLENEKIEMKSKMLGLEQQSLNSSMNRHFIFNALNSIQYYINRQDRLAANKYLSSFAKLIRKNLDSSQHTFTNLSDELERLELYLQLENMRFQDKFEYEIRIDENLDPDSIQVPAMLLQPFLENSIWHGILPKEEKGTVILAISSDSNGQVIFCISDDGIGFQTSKSSKAEDDNHISKGMDISEGRLELITRLTGKRASMTGPEEIIGQDGEVLGTRVSISIPSDWN